jgi:hypothetical protein
LALIELPNLVIMITSVKGGGVEHMGDASGLTDVDNITIATYWSSSR